MSDREPLPRCVGCGEPTTSRTDDGRPKHVGCPDHPSDREPILTPEYLAEIGAAFADEPIEVRRIVTSDHKLMLVVGPFSGPPAANPPDPTGDARSPGDVGPEPRQWPSRDEFSRMTATEVNEYFASIGVSTRVLAADPSPEPLRADVDRMARVLIAEWERVEGPVTASYVATFADLARAALTAAAPTAGAGGLDYEQMRKDRGWPTPNHMRRTADALDIFTPAKYGDVLRWFADLADASLNEAVAHRPTPAEQDRLAPYRVREGDPNANLPTRHIDGSLRAPAEPGEAT